MRSLVLSGFCVMLAACQPVPHEAPYPGSPGPAHLRSCGGDHVFGLIGQPITELPEAGKWGTLRVIGPGQPVTEDYSETRLNVEIDHDGRITGIWCG